MANYLDETGLALLWNKMKDTFTKKTDIPSTLKNPHALKFGTKNYDGSSVQTITAADLGALTSHQDISGKANKSTTLSGYGITDAYTKSETDTQIKTSISNKADKSTTLSGYGITDAYTKTETNTQITTAISKKADKSTTLSGYGITDAYTKSQVYTKSETDTAITDALATADALTYKGVLKQQNVQFPLIMTPQANKGDVYKIGELIPDNGFLNGNDSEHTVEIGDMIICNTDNTPAGTTSNYKTVNSCWDIIQGNISNVSAVAVSGSYNDLTNKPTIPSVSSISESTINSTCV